MPKISAEAQRERREQLVARRAAVDLAPLSWPYNRRELLPKGHGRTLVDSSRYCAGYKNHGLYPGALGIPGAPLAPFHPAPNRASRRRSGNYGHGHRIDYQPRTSPRNAPYVSGGRRSVTERAARRIDRWLRGEGAPPMTDWQVGVVSAALRAGRS